MLMGCAWTELRVEGLMDLKQSPGIDESRCSGSPLGRLLSQRVRIEERGGCLILECLPEATRGRRGGREGEGENARRL